MKTIIYQHSVTIVYVRQKNKRWVLSMFTNREINELGKRLKKELELHGRKFYDIKFAAKKRKAMHLYGTAKYTYNRLGYDTIEINPYIEAYDKLLNTMLHELAHCDLFARGDGHGPRWKKVAQYYSTLYNVNITRTGDEAIKIPGSYVVEVVWTDQAMRHSLRVTSKEYKRTYAYRGHAENFARKMSRYAEKIEIKAVN